ncbi:3-oxoacyl-[acyl-carrier-protein] synthase 3 [Planctomyces sp. SH-PL14]|nr:3-oxoacyl-[acyl-carrier-protein] synthase 3 [Planctomyces sp. SH-PL14]
MNRNTDDRQMVYLGALACHVPDHREDVSALCDENPGWNAETIVRKTGIRRRALARPEETAADLGYFAAERLFASGAIERPAIDGLIFNSHSPDYWMPATACLLQHRLGLPTTCAALDLALGCSGFTYSLWLAKSLVESGARRNVLVISAETFSRFCDRSDLSTVTLFGDGAGAALVTREPSGALARIGGTVLGTDGAGAEHLIVKGGAARSATQAGGEGESSRPRVWMNGPEVFSFTIATVRNCLQELVAREEIRWDEVRHFLLHQASGFMLDKLRTQLGLTEQQCPIDMEDVGNTANASLPILIDRLRRRGRFRSGDHMVLAGFGVGLSWAMTHLEWLENGESVPERE